MVLFTLTRLQGETNTILYTTDDSRKNFFTVISRQNYESIESLALFLHENSVKRDRDDV